MKLKKLKTRPFEVTFDLDLSRSNEESRIVEGYCFVNETVPGEGGVRLKRAAVEAATDDYMRWGAIREMHRAVAIGTATAEGCGVTWDGKGALLRAKIVDDAAWEKVKAGVYKAFSLYVEPRIMRGKDVERCVWTEVSLVDRPKDKDCPIRIARAEVPDVEAMWFESEDGDIPDALVAEFETENLARIDGFKAAIAGGTPKIMRGESANTLLQLLANANALPTEEEREAAFETAIQNFRAYALPIVQRGELGLEEVAEIPGELALSRSDAGYAEFPSVPDNQSIVVIRAEVYKDLSADYLARGARVKELEAMPRTRKPMRFTDHLDRAEMAKYLTEDAPDIKRSEDLGAELAQLIATDPRTVDANQRGANVVRMQEIKAELRSLGHPI